MISIFHAQKSFNVAESFEEVKDFREIVAVKPLNNYLVKRAITWCGELPSHKNRNLKIIFFTLIISLIPKCFDNLQHLSKIMRNQCPPLQFVHLIYEIIHLQYGVNVRGFFE